MYNTRNNKKSNEKNKQPNKWKSQLAQHIYKITNNKTSRLDYFCTY